VVDTLATAGASNWYMNIAKKAELQISFQVNRRYLRGGEEEAKEEAKEEANE
jgi:hypothetical protein